MNKKEAPSFRKARTSLILCVIVLACFGIGCVEPELTTTFTSEDIEITVNQTVYQTKTVKIPKEHWYEVQQEEVTGKVVKVIFNVKNRDFIVFEDSTILAVHQAEQYNWQIGKIHAIKKYTAQPGILSVQIIDNKKR